jgi:hypothetical protein
MKALPHSEDFCQLWKSFLRVIFTVIAGNEYHVFPVPRPMPSRIGDSLGSHSKSGEKEKKKERHNRVYDETLHAQNL